MDIYGLYNSLVAKESRCAGPNLVKIIGSYPVSTAKKLKLDLLYNLQSSMSEFNANENISCQVLGCQKTSRQHEATDL